MSTILRAHEAELRGRAILFFDSRGGRQNREEYGGEPSGHAPIV
jgi:hypothetical protein